MAPVHPVNLVALLHLCLSPIIFVEGNAGVNNMPFISPNPVEGPAQQDSEVVLMSGSKRAPISRMPSMGSFPDSDSYAFSHNEDLGFSIFLERRCKVVYFIRHAEAFHNIAEREHELGSLYLQEEHSGWKFWDAGLTPKGVEQCSKLRKELKSMAHQLDCEVVVVSPLTRTLQTARLTIGSVKFTDSPPPFIATDLCRERITNCPADSRRRLSVLKNEFPEVDFSQCIQSEHDSMWFDHKEDSQLCKERGIRFLKWLAKRPESRIAVVTHSGFLNRLFSQFGLGIAPDDQEELRRRPANCEMRGLILCAHRHFSDVPGTEGYEETRIY
mmetsp:Transcript_28637/g.64894  ORF Transcript_28637/g.64894 Transcript_28637/m.64894 type:complete len:328 (-) Transcript_28637:556-1539(-)